VVPSFHYQSLSAFTPFMTMENPPAAYTQFLRRRTALIDV